jgi:hypothetical protein
MSYVPPHARNNRFGQTNNGSKLKIEPAKKVMETKKVNDFPELGKPAIAQEKSVVQAKPVVQAKSVVQAKPALDFSKLFNENAEPVIKKEEMKRGLVKLTNNGIVDSLTQEEREEDDKMRTNRLITKNMIDYHNIIENSRQTQIAHDHNYVPEQVINEYSTSESSYYSTEDSELHVESDDDSCEL